MMRGRKGRKEYQGPDYLSAFDDNFLQQALSVFLRSSARAQLAKTSHRFFDLPISQIAATAFDGKLRELLQFVAHGKKREAESLVLEAPELLLFQGEATDYTRFNLDGQLYERKLQGSALEIALGAEDCGREGCDLYLMPPSHFISEETTLKKLALYTDDDPNSPFRYSISGKQFTIKSGGDSNSLALHHFNTLKAMFLSADLGGKRLNLDTEILTRQQREAYSALLKITSNEKHTLFVNEEGMIEMLMRHLGEMPDGEEMIAKQIGERFSPEWEEQEEKRHQADLEQLRKVRDALTAVGTNKDRDGMKYSAALLEFKKHLAPKGVITTEKHWNARLLAAAFEMGEKEWYRDEYRKNDRYYNEVIGFLNLLAPACRAMEQAQGLLYLSRGEKFNRNLKYRFGHGSYFPISSAAGFQLGSSSWVDCYFGERTHGRPHADGDGRRRERFGKLLSDKNSKLASIYAGSRRSHIINGPA